MSFFNKICSFIFLLCTFFIAPYSFSELIRHDFVFRPNSGTGTGHPALFDGNDDWVGFFEYDLTQSSQLTFGNSIQYSINEGYGRMYIDFGQYAFTVNDLTITRDNGFKETVFFARLSVGTTIELPVLPEDYINTSNFIMDDFSIRLLSRDRYSISNATLTARGAALWDWQRNGTTSITDGYIVDDENAISEPQVFYLTLLVVFGLMRKGRINYQHRVSVV